MFRRVNLSITKKVIPLSLLIKKMAENTGDRTWGVDNSPYRLASTEHFGRPSTPDEYIHVKQDELKLPLYKDCTQASHCMIYARNNEKIFGVYHPRASVLMHMRFDGYIGFPGGLVDSGEEIVDGLNRELVEEINLDLSKYKVTKNDYIISHYSVSKKICLHFYAMELSLDDLVEVERNAIFSKDYGTEVLGNVRVPLYTMGDGYRGFPVFLNNSFIGAIMIVSLG
ncbi:U8 snoRNA-decapping enzyme-like isoform X2 [Lycorma delicatula]|uniref:U8 snoRNA-decapping enzyme-like isoform X2 n=1 Tax=Lycorma delicatula TaxID=130591 RepID=UPI003F513260